MRVQAPTPCGGGDAERVAAPTRTTTVPAPASPLALFPPGRNRLTASRLRDPAMLFVRGGTTLAMRCGQGGTKHGHEQDRKTDRELRRRGARRRRSGYRLDWRGIDGQECGGEARRVGSPAGKAGAGR